MIRFKAAQRTHVAQEGLLAYCLPLKGQEGDKRKGDDLSSPFLLSPKRYTVPFHRSPPVSSAALISLAPPQPAGFSIEIGLYQGPSRHLRPVGLCNEVRCPSLPLDAPAFLTCLSRNEPRNSGTTRVSLTQLPKTRYLNCLR